MMKGKLLSIILVLAMIMTLGGNEIYSNAAIGTSGKNSSKKKKEYILTADNINSFNQLKEKVNNQGKWVVRHDISDEQYLEDNRRRRPKTYGK